jgi:hypothetical protein
VALGEALREVGADGVARFGLNTSGA